MFGHKRRKAAKAAVEAIQPIVGTFQHHYGLPAGFWQDPYVVGFIGFMIGHHAKTATHGKITGEEYGLAIGDAFSELSNLNGAKIMERYENFALADPKIPDFERGADNSATICYYVMGILKNEAENEHVLAAKKMAEREGSGPTDRQRIASYMLFKLFNKEVQNRFQLAD